MSNVLGNLIAMPIYDNNETECDPKAVSISADFNGVDEYSVSLKSLKDATKILSVKGCFFDNSRNNTPVILTADNVNQTLVFPLRTQGYMPLLMNQEIEFDLSTTAGTGIFKMNLLNFIVNPYMWSATL